MKTVLMAVWLTMIGLSVVAAGLTGGGRVVSATTVPSVVTNIEADVVSAYNGGSNRVWLLVNSSEAAVSNAAAAGTALPLPAGQTYVFDTRGKKTSFGKITSVGVVTTSDTSTVYLQWF